MTGVGLSKLNSPASADEFYTPRIYSATALGMGTVIVTMAFDAKPKEDCCYRENKIVGIRVDSVVVI